MLMMYAETSVVNMQTLEIVKYCRLQLRQSPIEIWRRLRVSLCRKERLLTPAFAASRSYTRLQSREMPITR